MITVEFSRPPAAQGDTVMMLLTLTGTHTGAFMNIPPSGETFTVHLCDIFRFNDEGKMIEGWVVGKGDLRDALAARAPG